MGHLSTTQLVDLAEGAQTESSAPHLRSCAACRQQLAELRAVMAAVTGVDAPEPSPLFWEHFSARVHAAVDASRERGFWTRLTQRLAARAERVDGWRPGIGPAAGLVVLVAAVAILIQAARPVPRPVVAGSAVAAVESPNDVTVDDPSLSLVADLAADLDWDAAREAGLTTHVGVDDDAVNQLTSGERGELGRLLRAELSRHGA